MIIKINGEEFAFDSWEDLGLTLKELCIDGNSVTISCGAVCKTCKGVGLITVFNLGDSRPVFMECAECDGTGMKG